MLIVIVYRLHLKTLGGSVGASDEQAFHLGWQQEINATLKGISRQFNAGTINGLGGFKKNHQDSWPGMSCESFPSVGLSPKKGKGRKQLQNIWQLIIRVSHLNRSCTFRRERQPLSSPLGQQEINLTSFLLPLIGLPPVSSVSKTQTVAERQDNLFGVAHAVCSQIRVEVVTEQIRTGKSSLFSKCLIAAGTVSSPREPNEKPRHPQCHDNSKRKENAKRVELSFSN